MIDHNHWKEAQYEEQRWWGDCANTYWEEHKQLTYAKYMGLEFYEDHQSPYNIDAKGKNIMDIGGGPVSLLLKAKNLKQGYVVDPCQYPKWVRSRYKTKNISLMSVAAEKLDYITFEVNEVWMYNCLQHTEDPRQIIKNGLSALTDDGVFRIFEWIDTPTNDAHPHSMTENYLNEQFNAVGKTVELSADGCYGKAYYGAFYATN